MRAALLIRLPSTVIIAVLLVGCYQTSGVLDAGAPDGEVTPPDGSVIDADGSVTDADVIECPSYGTTRLCGDYCTESCPSGFVCSAASDICRPSPEPDPRGPDACPTGSDSRLVRYCDRGTFCLRTSTFGTLCVSREYCDFTTSGEALEGHHCEYADRTLFVDGPPDDACPPGGDPGQPFCGGRCGDTCAFTRLADWDDQLSCVGMSESRGVGLCTWEGFSCRVDVSEGMIGSQLDECEMSLLGPCACAIPLDGALAPDSGWLVTARSCAAYRAAYPETISCRGRGGVELP